MATILNNKKSTYGSPYCYYTVEYTSTSNRTTAEVDITFKVTSHLASSTSSIGTGSQRTLKAQLYINGSWSAEQTLKGSNDSWSGTSNHTKTFTLTISNLSSSTTTLSGIKFKVNSRMSDQASGLNATSCSDITIPTGSEPPVVSSFTMTEQNSNVNTVPGSMIVENLSIKRFNVTYTLDSSVTLSKIIVENGANGVIKESTTNNFDIDFSTINLYVVSANNKVPLVVRAVDSNGNIGSTSLGYYDYIGYKLPTINESDTIVKRIGQTSGKVGITVSGTIYNNTIGSLITPQKPTIRYSYYEYPNGTTYTGTIPNANITISSNTYSVSNYNIGSETTSATNYFDPEKSYRVSITVSDKFTKRGSNISFNSVSLSEAKSVPLGEALWTEYKDRVDFKKLTLKNAVDLYDTLFYKSNDILEIGDTNGNNSLIMNGYISNSTKSLYFNINVPKNLENINTITCNSMNIEARGISGYLNSTSGYVNYATSSSYTINCTKVGNYIIRFAIHKSSAFTNVTNNTPISLSGYINLTLT